MKFSGISYGPADRFLCGWGNWPSCFGAGVGSCSHANGGRYFAGLHRRVWALFGAYSHATARITVALYSGHDAGRARGIFEKKVESIEASLPRAAGAEPELQKGRW